MIVRSRVPRPRGHALLGRLSSPSCPHKFSVAPMMDYTNQYQRYLMRLMTKKAVLYTEMVTSMALVNAKKELMGFAAEFDIEQPVVLQLGGSSPKSMRDAAMLAKQYGYTEININVGCPSSKVAGAGCFGAALMLEPILVGEIASEIISATGLPTTVKCRIGVNDTDSYESLVHFIRTVHEMSGMNHFIVHARKAILNASFSPADNRKIPPLIYPVVYALCKDFPQLQFTVNGGITDFDSIQEHYDNGVSGVMVGRAVVEDPFYWRRVDSELYGEKLEEPVTQADIFQRYANYARKIEDIHGKRCRNMVVKPIMNLSRGLPNAKMFRNSLSQGARDHSKGIGDVILSSADLVLSHDS